MTEIDTMQKIYLFLHGRMDLKDRSITALKNKGFSEEQIVMAQPNKVGAIGNYMAMLWMPPNPDHIKLQQITEIKDVEPEGMIGLWKGVSKIDIESIPL